MVGWLVYIIVMEKVNIYEAKTRLSELVREALAGEEVIISKNGIPAVRLVPVRKENTKRELGFYAGKIVIADDFDAPLEDFKDYM
jgi:prevent-host-death family protein